MTDLALDARSVFDAAVRSVQAPSRIAGVDLEAVAGRPLGSFRRVVVVGAGKASAALAGALEARLSSVALTARVEGAVVVPHTYP
ncbi:DUF4147 domain-containing protein, partial [Rubrivirga sp.]|uniref:DUF4147 domain-containing protein n=1 Tax=Rubrivirga sp. TaxID=1885344 RepID=UPI003C74A7A5